MPQRPSEVNLRVYSATKCGYFKWGSDAPTIDARQSLFPSAGSWVRTRGRMTATRTEFIGGEDEGRLDLDRRPLLCRGIAEEGGDQLFAMYQVIGQGDTAVSSMAVDALVNQEDPEPVAINGNRFAGISRYFWTLPDCGAVCSVRFKGGGIAMDQFGRWLRDYLSFWDDSVVRLETPAGDRVLYPRAADLSSDPPRLWARVALCEAIDPRTRDRVLRLAASVRGVWFKGSRAPSALRTESESMFGRIATIMPSDVFEGRATVARVMLREPTPNGLDQQVVRELQQQWLEDRERLDLGFEIEGGQIIWMSRPRPLRQSVPLVFRGDGEEQIDLQALLSILRSQFRSQAVQAVREAEGT